MPLLTRLAPTWTVVLSVVMEPFVVITSVPLPTLVPLLKVLSPDKVSVPPPVLVKPPAVVVWPLKMPLSLTKRLLLFNRRVPLPFRVLIVWSPPNRESVATVAISTTATCESRSLPSSVSVPVTTLMYLAATVLSNFTVPLLLTVESPETLPSLAEMSVPLFRL